MSVPFNCRRVALLLSRGEFEIAGWLSGMLARAHLALCPHCRRYRMQLDLIGVAVRLRRARRAAPERIEALQQRLVRFLAGGGGQGGGT